MDQTNEVYIVTMAKEGSTQIVHFMTPGAGFFVLGLGHMSHSENALNLLKYLKIFLSTSVHGTR